MNCFLIKRLRTKRKDEMSNPRKTNIVKFNISLPTQ